MINLKDLTKCEFHKENKLDKLLIIFFVIHVIGTIATIEFHYKNGTLEWASKHGDGVRFSTPADVIMNDCICWEVYLLMRIIDFITDYINIIFENNFKEGKKMNAENTNCPRPGEQCDEFMYGSSVDGTYQFDIGTCEFCSDFMAEPKLKEINMYEGSSLNGEFEYRLDIERPDGFIPEKWRSKSLKINYCPICGRKLSNA